MQGHTERVQLVSQRYLKASERWRVLRHFLTV